MVHIAITGYRPVKLPAVYGYDLGNPAYQKLAAAIRDTVTVIALEHKDIQIECITGMALGVDQLFAKTALALKQTPELHKTRITAAIPCYGYETRWPVASRELYHDILSQCDTVEYVHKGSYTPACMDHRNRWMVDRADAIIAVWNGLSGGTKNCIDYAVRNRKTIYYIDPEDYRITVRRPA